MCRFRDAWNTMVIACCHVVQEGRPVLRITHDADGMWQFLCGGVHEEADARIIALSEAAALDVAVTRAAWLPRGWCAQRRGAHGLWLIKRKR